MKNEIITHVANAGGVPSLFVNGEVFPAAAYMTYLEKRNHYADFAAVGYRFFSVPVLFAGRWISVTKGLTPFQKGIFDEKGKPDFTPAAQAFRRILESCPDALILPRVNISLPEWWENEHPQDVNLLSDGSSRRESFYSDAWRETEDEYIRRFLRALLSSEFAGHIAGIQLACGNTEEWFHFDLNAGHCANAERGFQRYLREHCPGTEYRGLPDLSPLSSGKSVFSDDYLSCFLAYASDAAAEAISRFARVTKKETHGKLAVGAFYGYTLEVTSPLWGTHALNRLLNDPNLDFFCSPNSYIRGRAADCDWTEMYPADSVRLHGKMCFQECDIRTHLSRLLCDTDPETDPDRIMTSDIWLGPPTKELARDMLRKAFARQLIKGNGLWWFDMWGGWFDDEDILRDMESFRELYSASLRLPRASVSEIAVFVDEKAYRTLAASALRDAPHAMREPLGRMGAPYDCFDIADFTAVRDRYKAFLFLSCVPTKDMTAALSFCEMNERPFLAVSEEKPMFTAAELRTLLRAAGVHIYTASDDIVYVNESCLAVYAVTEGEKVIDLGKRRPVTGLLPGTEPVTTDRLTFPMRQYETRLFLLF